MAGILCTWGFSILIFPKGKVPPCTFLSVTQGCHASKSAACFGLHIGAVIALLREISAVTELHSPLEEWQPCSVVLYAGIFQLSLFYILNAKRKSQEEGTKPKFADWWLKGGLSDHLLGVTEMQGLGAGQMQHTEMEKTEQIHGHHHIACPGLYMLHRVVKTGHGSLPLPHKSLSRWLLILRLTDHWLLPIFLDNPEGKTEWMASLTRITLVILTRIFAKNKYSMGKSFLKCIGKLAFHPLPLSWSHIKWKQSFMSTTFAEQQVSTLISWAWLCTQEGQAATPRGALMGNSAVQIEMQLLRGQQLPTGWQRGWRVPNQDSGTIVTFWDSPRPRSVLGSEGAMRGKMQRLH